MKFKNTLIILLMCLSNISFSQISKEDLQGFQNSGENNFYQIQKNANNYWNQYHLKDGKYLKNGKLEKMPNWKLYKRWEWFWEARINKSTGDFPKTSTPIEFEKYIANNAQLKSTNGNWTGLGPNGSRGGYAGIGRINCVSFHPTNANAFWVGSPSGGLWSTIDGGNNWSVLTDDNVVLGVSDIAIPGDYETSKTIYIATGDRDAGSAWNLGGGNYGDNNTIGVLKSTNSGQTWVNVLSFVASQRAVMGFLRIHPTNNNILYAGVSNLVYKSTNGGANWSLSYNGSDYYIDMEFNPSNPEIIYIASKKSSGGVKILRSLNGGNSWTEQYTFGSEDSRVELAVSEANPNVVYAAVANKLGGLSGIFKSTNNGDTFTKVFNGDDEGHKIFGYYSDGSGDNKGQGNYDLAFVVSPNDANTLYLGGINTWKSIDGGASWVINNMWTSSSSYNMASPKAPSVHADKHVLKFQNTSTLFEGNDGGIYKTTNGGLNWSDISNGMVISQMYRLGVYAGSIDTIITGLQDNGSKLYYNGNWADVTGGDGMECLIDYTDSKIQYGTYIHGQVSRTTDLWNSSTDIYENIGDGSLEGAWVTPYIIDPLDHNTIYVGYQDVWKSTDMGDTFVKISTMNTSNNLRSMAIAPSDNQILYVADQSHIWLTKDGGTSWVEVTHSLPVSANSITNLAVHAYNPNIAWVTFGGYDGDRIYQTINAGESWTNISSGLPNLPVFSVIQNKLAVTENHLYLGTDLGVYFKEANTDWVLFSTGLPNVMVTELEIYYDNTSPGNSRLLAATFGRGLWSSDLKSAPAIIVDAGILSIEEPVNKTYCGSQIITPKVVVKNYGITALTSLVISYQIDGGNLISKSWTGNLTQNQTVNISLANLNLGIGSHTFSVSISDINGGNDENINNNNKSVNFVVANNEISLPYIEGFNSEFAPECWTIETVTDNVGSGSPSISFVTSSSQPSASPFEGSHLLMFNAANCDIGDQSRFSSPSFSTINKSGVEISFMWYENTQVGSSLDNVKLQWSLDGSVWNNGSTYDRYNASNSGWVLKSFNLPNEALNQTTVYLSFLFTSANGNNCLLDLLNIKESATATITTGVISGSPFIISGDSGTAINVPFTSLGTFTSNEYKAYLSDASGSFTNEVEIGSLTSDADSGTIQANIPAGTSVGTSYKVRVKSSNPVIVGSESSPFEVRVTTSSITIGSISGSPFVVSKVLGKVINIPFTISGSFTANTFTGFLSNKNGDFSTETQIGTLVSNSNGTLLGIIPANTPESVTYKVRVKSSSPALISAESQVISIVLDTIGPTVTVSSNVANPTNVSPIEVSIVFSEEVSGFDISKIAVVNATKDQFTLLGNSSFSVKLSPIVDGVVSASVAQGVAFDALGNPNSASQPWSTTYIRALGIEDLLKEGILIFPNPASNVLNIKFDKIQKKVNLKVIGVDGRLYHSMELLNSNIYQLDISDLAKGIYIIQLITEGKVLNAQLIKQ